MDCIKLLVAHSADLRRCNKAGEEAIHIAVINNHTEAMKALVALGGGELVGRDLPGASQRQLTLPFSCARVTSRGRPPCTWPRRTPSYWQMFCVPSSAAATAYRSSRRSLPSMGAA